MNKKQSGPGASIMGLAPPGSFRSVWMKTRLAGQVQDVGLRASIILCLNLKKCLGMGADGAELRGLLADQNMAAVAARPDCDAALTEHLLGLHIVQQRAVAILMMAFHLADHPEFGGQFRKPLFFGGFGEAFIQIGPIHRVRSVRRK